MNTCRLAHAFHKHEQAKVNFAWNDPSYYAWAKCNVMGFLMYAGLFLRLANSASSKSYRNCGKYIVQCTRSSMNCKM